MSKKPKQAGKDNLYNPDIDNIGENGPMQQYNLMNVSWLQTDINLCNIDTIRV